MADVRTPVEVVTFGCRLNLVESEAIRRAALAAGRDNLVIVNSCAVTGEAVRQARQTIRRIRRERPGVTILVTGCAAQTETAGFAAMPEVDGMVGNGVKTEVGSWRHDDGAAAPPRAGVPDVMALTGTATPLAEAIPGHTRAFVQVQTGCDHRCTFCIIPYGRGPSRSVPMGAVTDAIARLVEQGIADVALTGVDLTSYGADLPGAPRLGTLVAAILYHVPALRRLRLSSIDSVEADETLVGLFASEERLMPHLHLSLQAGDDLILKRMKRRHGFDDAVALCERLRRLRPDIVFGADIIAGFPTETEAQFQRSLDLVEACGLTHLHVFPFSPRAGTPAARMPQVAGAAIRERAARLRAAGDAALTRHLDRQAGRMVEVLAERGGIGRTADFTAVILPEGVAAGSFLTGRVSGHAGGRLWLDAGVDAPSALVAAAATG